MPRSVSDNQMARSELLSPDKGILPMTPGTRAGRLLYPSLRSHRWLTSGVVAGLIVGAGGVMYPTAATPLPAHSVAIGLRLADSDGTMSGKAAWNERLTSRELAAGAKYEMVATGLRGFRATIPAWVEEAAKATGHTAVISWAMGYAPGIVVGRLDSTLRAKAV